MRKTKSYGCSLFVEHVRILCKTLKLLVFFKSFEPSPQKMKKEMSKNGVAKTAQYSAAFLGVSTWLHPDGIKVSMGNHIQVWMSLVCLLSLSGSIPCHCL